MFMNNVLQSLFETIQQRKENPPAGSYTARLFAGGENEICKKIGEEAVEVIIAAKGEGDERVIYEMADLFYHNLVLLAARDIRWAEVEAELARRMK
jgi:phosphoribosyl-ATP pyrophosphohydrolase